MADDTTRAELALLRARIARLEAGRPPRTRSHPFRRVLPLALVALLLALVPLGILAANPFTDLDPAQATGHNPNIDLLFTAGITKGCNPPENTQYCPKDVVTREQMASFLARTAGLGANAPVVNALTAVTATTAINAGNANTVGGLPPNALLRVASAKQAEQQEASPPSSLNVTAQYPAFQTAVTLTIAAPGPGFLLVNASILSGATSGASVFIRLHEPQTNASSPLQLANLSGGTNLISSMALTHVFPVTAGTRTILLQVSTGPTTTGVADGSMTALFVPYGSTGTAAP